MSSTVNKIIILGGGTAGWLSAAILASQHQSNTPSGVQVTLIESPDVKTLGVGEGTWPTMRDTLRKVGISESEFIRQCDASFKQGSLFKQWRDGKPDDQYLHPFALPAGFFDVDIAAHWCESEQAPEFAHAVSPQWHLCEKSLAPKQAGTPEYAAVANYAYHLDAGKFAELLRKHCTGKLGVVHVKDHMESVEAHANGDIAALVGKTTGRHAADLFVDCSGFSAKLIGEHFQVPFIDQKHVLFNDTALAVQVPYADEEQPIASATLSTAQEAGWIWDIGLPTRRGTGYVYSSAHTSENRATEILLSYAAKGLSSEQVSNLDVRKIAIRPGYRKTFWEKNCVAIGTSAGFIEPLEASALVMIELSARMLADNLPQNQQHMAMCASRFNDVFSYRWQRIIEFLKLHYILSQREDSSYWLDNRAADSIPTSLQAMMERWQYQSPSKADFPYIDEIFPAASYQYVLYGMGFRTHSRTTAFSDLERMKARQSFENNHQMTQRFLSGLPDNRTLLAHIRNNDLPVGPAR